MAPLAGRSRRSRKQDKFDPTAVIPEHSIMNLPPHKWRVPQRFELSSVLGSGAYGTVCEAYDREGDRRVAIKRIARVFDDLAVAKSVLREVSILARLASPHVVHLHDVVVPHGDMTNFNELFIVMEIGDTDLKALMQTDIEFTSEHVKWIFHNLLCGLKYLHSIGVYHRDLKPANVLVNEDCAVKICDFGIARAVGKRSSPLSPEEHLPPGDNGSPVSSPASVLSPASVVSPASAKRHAQRVMTPHVVTRHYRAPELILLQGRYTEAIDMWSAGCIYAEMTQLLAGARANSRRGPLFPGTTCFPLSPDVDHPGDGFYHSKGRREQLNVIFDVLGTPMEEELGQLDREDARNYIRCFAPRVGLGLQRRLPHAGSDSIDLLEHMLRFGPENRISAERALGHRLLAGIGGAKGESMPSESSELSFGEERILNEQDLRERLAREIRSFSSPLIAQRIGGA